MSHRFSTKQEAREAGYRGVNKATDKDISGPNSFGYQFEDPDGNRTVDVWFSEELNLMHQPGCVIPMYPPK